MTNLTGKINWINLAEYKKIENRLKISYDALNGKEHQLFFLNMACVFMPEYKAGIWP
jgi:hypothetical protein